MSKSIARGLVGAGAILLAILLTGCSDEPSPTPSAGAVATPTATAQPGVTPEPTPAPTLAPTHTPTPEPTPTPAAATLPLGVYLTLCAPPEQVLANDATYGDLSSVLAAEADRLEALTPPAQLSEWHLVNIEAYRTAQAGVDTQPKDDVMVDNLTMNAVEDDFAEKLREAAARVPKDVRQHMIEADCIDPDVVPDDYTDVPDGQGDDIDSTTVAAATLSLDEYLTLCATTEQDLADDATFGDFSSLFAAEADRLEALTPPVQLSEWHLLNMENFRTIQAFIELQPKDDVIDVARFFLIAAISADSEEKLRAAAARLPEDIRQQMIQAGCIDPEDLPDNYEAVPDDDHGNNLESATRIAIGEAVAIEFEDPDDKELFVFLVEPGAEYVITLNWESWNRWSYPSRPIMALFDADGQELARLENSDFSSNSSRSNKMMWQAVTGGDYHIAVGDGATFGSFTLTVTDGEATEQPERDDHGSSEGDATAIRVGTEVRGAVDYDGDIDFFRFQAERGQTYQIDVALGTLDDSIVELYDVDWSFLDTNNDYGDTYASRLYWEAPSSGERYVAVWGWGTGTYTLTVSLSDLIDDHGNSEGDATAIRMGADVRGALEYDGDIDYFRFQAERGQSYQIEVALGTLDDSIVDLYDADGSLLDSNDDHGDTYASRLYWEAPSSGERYVAVEGYGVGTYTLTVSIVDDHGDTAEDGVGVASDRAALVALYNATEGGSWTTRTNWLSGRPLDEWHGVTTDSGGRVTALNLMSNRLVGALPAALGDLTNLRTLILWTNDELTGPIPAWLGDLTNLRWLILGGNGLTGEIPPELAGLSNLQRLYLNHNRLTGEIPPELASLSNLTELYLNDNRLTGEIPPELGRPLQLDGVGSLRKPVDGRDSA